MQNIQNISTNVEQRLFVLSQGDGYSCFGFDNCFEHSKQLAHLVSRPDLAPKAEEIGDIKQYQGYQELVQLAARKDLGTYFDPGTPEEIKNILEAYRRDQRRIRVYLGDTQTGRDWMNEHDVVGRVGRSMGPLRVPLLVMAGDAGGGAILTNCIVRLQDSATKVDLYRHPTYNLPAISFKDCTDPKLLKQGYKAEVVINGEVHARFKTRKAAETWYEFMQGLRMRA